MDIGLDGYRDLVMIGRGGFGVVYRAYEEALDRTVAIKVLTGRLDVDAQARFSRERLAMSRLSDHPNVVPVYRTGVTTDGHPFLMMPYLASGSAEDRLAAGPPFTWADATRIAIRLAGALETAHRMGVVHRDVKPANVLLSEYGEPLLTDFGIARVSGGFETTAGQVTASIAFAAPELLEGGTPTPAADVYSLGATLFNLVAGHAPFEPSENEELLSLYRRIARDPVPDLRAKGVPEQLCRVMEQAMAKRPPQRPRTALDLGVLLQQVQRAEGRPITEMALGHAGAHSGLSAATVTSSAAQPLPSRTRRRVLIGVLTLVVLVLIGTGVVYGLHRGARSRHPAVAATSDATPRGTALTLSAATTEVHVRTAAAQAASIRIAVRAGESMVGEVRVASRPVHPIAISILSGTGPLEQATLTDYDAALDPVRFDSAGTVVVLLGPSKQALDATVELSLAPPDVVRRLTIGTRPVRIELSRPRQIADVSFTGRTGSLVTVHWTWLGANPQYTSLDLHAPDGTDLARGGWSARTGFRSPTVRLPSVGTYVVRISIDGAGTGAGSLAVTAG